MSKWNARSARTTAASSRPRPSPPSRARRCCTPESCRAQTLREMAGERAVALATLLERLPDAQITGAREIDVTSIETASHAVRPGALFVALRGTRTDGHRYVPEAIVGGA